MSKKLITIVSLVLAFSLISFGAVMAQEYNQAPELDLKVENGELEPVAERLPNNPKVVDLLGEGKVGQYGGTMDVFIKQSLPDQIMRRIGYEPLFRYGAHTDFLNIQPNIATDIEVGEDSKEFTIHLREGLKWSDGEPFTAEDVAFYYEDFQKNKEIRGRVYRMFRNEDGSPADFETIDKHTVKWTFKNSFGTFPQRLAEVRGRFIAAYPKHYMKKFLPKYTEEEELKERVEEGGYRDWKALFDDKQNYRSNPDMPVMNAWKITANYKQQSTVTAVRNPYYWKVDKEGNQLPYINKIKFDVLRDPEVAVPNVLTNNYDHVHSAVNTMENKAVFHEAMQKGNLNMSFVPMKSTYNNSAVICFNQNHPDEDYEAIFQNPKFRKAISYGIDRAEIIESVFYGQAEPKQPSPKEESPFYHEEYATSYLEYNPDKTKEMLDEIGLKDQDGDGWRELPNGEDFPLVYPIIESKMDTAEMITEDLKALGLNVKVRQLGWRGWRGETTDTAKFDITHWHGDGGMEVLMEARHYIPEKVWSLWAVKWATWNATGGEAGVEPPETIKNMINWYNKAKATADIEKQKEYMKKIFDKHAENLYVVGVSTEPDGYGLVSKDIVNHPTWWWDSWKAPQPATAKFFQMWFQE